MSERIRVEAEDGIINEPVKDVWLDNGPDYDESDFEYLTEASRAGTDYAGTYGTPKAAAAFEDLYNTPLDSRRDTE